MLLAVNFILQSKPSIVDSFTFWSQNTESLYRWLIAAIAAAEEPVAEDVDVAATEAVVVIEAEVVAAVEAHRIKAPEASVVDEVTTANLKEDGADEEVDEAAAIPSRAEEDIVAAAVVATLASAEASVVRVVMIAGEEALTVAEEIVEVVVVEAEVDEAADPLSQ